jgi:hypothetical protein
LTAHASSWRSCATSNTKNRWTTQTTQPMGRPVYHIKSHPSRIIRVDDWRRHPHQELMAHWSIMKISCLECHKKHTTVLRRESI